MTTVGTIDSIVPSVLLLVRVHSFGDPCSGIIVPTSRIEADPVTRVAELVDWELARTVVVSFGAATLRLIYVQRGGLFEYFTHSSSSSSSLTLLACPGGRFKILSIKHPQFYDTLRVVAPLNVSCKATNNTTTAASQKNMV